MKINIKEAAKNFFTHIANTKYLSIIFIVGIVLVLLPVGNSAQETKKTDETEDFAEYKEKMEEELQSILGEIKGAGKVSVMITFSDEGNIHYAVDESASYSQEDNGKTQNTEKHHVLRSDNANGELPVVAKKSNPEISGVLICAEGARDSQVKDSITRAVGALLGVKSHRIEVLERK